MLSEGALLSQWKVVRSRRILPDWIFSLTEVCLVGDGPGLWSVRRLLSGRAGSGLAEATQGCAHARLNADRLRQPARLAAS
jgi:hypothetical protein